MGCPPDSYAIKGSSSSGQARHLFNCKEHPGFVSEKIRRPDGRLAFELRKLLGSFYERRRLSLKGCDKYGRPRQGILVKKMRAKARKLSKMISDEANARDSSVVDVASVSSVASSSTSADATSAASSDRVVSTSAEILASSVPLSVRGKRRVTFAAANVTDNTEVAEVEVEVDRQSGAAGSSVTADPVQDSLVDADVNMGNEFDDDFDKFFASLLQSRTPASRDTSVVENVLPVLEDVRSVLEETCPVMDVALSDVLVSSTEDEVESSVTATKNAEVSTKSSGADLIVGRTVKLPPPLSSEMFDRDVRTMMRNIYRRGLLLDKDRPDVAELFGLIPDEKPLATFVMDLMFRTVLSVQRQADEFREEVRQEVEQRKRELSLCASRSYDK